MNKPLLLLLAVLVAPFAAAQTSASLSSTYQPADHAQPASHQSLQIERALVSDSVVTAAGEMPLSDVPLPAVHEEPLGDVARRYRGMSRDAQASAAQPVLKRSTGAFPGWWLAD
jgi:hypothetical protein